MPWKECKPMDERLRFIARLLEGEQMAALCREFGISRVTGYKIYNRYKDSGLDGLNDRSRAPYRQANKLPFQIERTILGIKKEHPSWGARKIRDKLLRQYTMIKPPAISTVHAVLDRHGLEYDLRWTLGGQPFLTTPGELVGAVQQAIASETGITTELSTTGGTSDGRFIAQICPQVIELGPPNATIHKIDEHVVVANIEPLKNIYRRTLENLHAQALAVTA